MHRMLARAAAMAAMHWCILAGAAGAAGESTAPEAGELAGQVQAVFVTKFPQFIEWPRDVLESGGPGFRICLLGDVAFASDIETIARTRRVHGRPLKIVRIGSDRSFAGCHVLFLGESEQRHLPRILASLESTSVLTVSAMERFVERGGMIGFFRSAGHVGFRINREAAQRAGLVVSSQLLKLSETHPALGSVPPKGR